jgi:prophage DNA circulation protein
MPRTEVNELFPPCAWEVEGVKITFPIDNIREGYRNRIVRHERLFRDGARLDDTGSKETIWTLTVSFYNDNDEPGIDTPELQYPHVVDRLTDACKIHETGTLYTPTKGPRRCRAESYDRDDDAEDRESARVTFVFVEDNEDDETQREFSQVATGSAARKDAEEGVDAAYKEGAGGGFDMSDFNNFARELEGLANAPGDFVKDIDAKAEAIQRKIESIEDTFTTAKNEALTEVALLLTNPGASLAGRRMRRVGDLGKRAASQAAAGQIGETTTITFTKWVSIFDVATKVGQEADKLMYLNPTLPEPMAIEPKTPITIYDTPAVRNAKAS